MAREVLREEKGVDVKLACTLHGTDITLVGRQKPFYELTRFTIAKQDLLTAPSDFLARDTERAFRIDENKVVPIPNFVDLDRFSVNPSENVRSVLTPNGERLITHVSNFREVKRPDHVVRSFAILNRRVPLFSPWWVRVLRSQPVRISLRN